MADNNPISDDMLEDVTGGIKLHTAVEELLKEHGVSTPSVAKPSTGGNLTPFICPYCHKQIMIYDLNEITCPECHKRIHIDW